METSKRQRAYKNPDVKSIRYSYQDTSHVDLAHTKGHTADLETSRTLLSCMISENAKRTTTIDLTDFYLGTPLPHPEFIRLPISMTQISPRWNLKRGTTNLESLALTDNAQYLEKC